MRNEQKTCKNDDEFKDLGKIVAILENDNYKVQGKGSRELIRHVTQLRVWPGSVGDCRN